MDNMRYCPVARAPRAGSDEEDSRSGGRSRPFSRASSVASSAGSSGSAEHFPDEDFFRMYEFKVKRCPCTRPHDWTVCPFTHPGERARRRDPRVFNYSGTPCPDFKRDACKRGDACEFAHGVFETNLHPSRYRTSMCTEGARCTRKIWYALLG